MRYLKLFENFNDDDLIKFLSNPQDITLINNKELDFITQSDLDLIYNNLISKFIDGFNFKLDKAKGYDQLSGQTSDEKNNWIDFEPNRLVNFQWKFTNNAFIQVNKYQDDWWLVIIDAYWIFEESKKSYFGSIKFFLCDTREALLSLYDWLEAWDFFKTRLVQESISDYSDGDLMTQISAEQFFEIEEEFADDQESMTQAEIEYFKSKMKSTGIPYSSWGLYTLENSRYATGYRDITGSFYKIVFRLNRRVDYNQKLHYTSLNFQKFKDDFWLCEMLSDSGRGDDYKAMFHVIIDSKEGLEEFFRWCQEPKRRDFFRIEPLNEMLLQPRPESDAVQIFKSWLDFDEFLESRELEKLNVTEINMFSELVSNFIEIYNQSSTVFELKHHTKYHMHYNSSIIEWEISIVDKIMAYDYNIQIYKFVDDYWIIQFHLPDMYSPEGGDTVYFLCDSRDGIRDSKEVFKNYLEG